MAQIKTLCSFCGGDGIIDRPGEFGTQCGHCGGDGYLSAGELDEIEDIQTKLDAMDTKMDTLGSYLDTIEAKIDQLLP